MPCCNQARLALQKGLAQRGSREPADEVFVRLIPDSFIAVAGTATGRRYVFSARRPVQRVDARDATDLLRHGDVFRPLAGLVTERDVLLRP